MGTLCNIIETKFYSVSYLPSDSLFKNIYSEILNNKDSNHDKISKISKIKFNIHSTSNAIEEALNDFYN